MGNNKEKTGVTPRIGYKKRTKAEGAPADWSNPARWWENYSRAMAMWERGENNGIITGPHWYFDKRFGREGLALACLDIDIDPELKKRQKEFAASNGGDLGYGELYEEAKKCAMEKFNKFIRPLCKGSLSSLLGPIGWVITGSGGLHIYFLYKLPPEVDSMLKESPDNWRNLADSNVVHLKAQDASGALVEVAELKIGPGTQLVAPLSYHINGNRYLPQWETDGIDMYSELPVVEWEDLKELIHTLMQVKSVYGANATRAVTAAEAKRDERIQKTGTSSRDPEVARLMARFKGGLTTASILEKYGVTPTLQGVREGKNGREMYGPHPMHGSSTGQNFHVNLDRNIWHCFRHGGGGGMLDLIVMLEGLAECEDIIKGVVPLEVYIKAIESARAKGLLPPVVESDGGERATQGAEERVAACIMATDMSDIQTDRSRVTLIEAPPRIGKTRWAVMEMIKHGEGNYITHRHSIVKHAVRIAKENGIRGGVTVVGLNQPGACRTNERNCKSCPLLTAENAMKEHYAYAMELMHASIQGEGPGVLTPDDVKDKGMCPYTVLRLAEQEARFVFTVIHCADVIRPRGFVVIDEDATMQHLFPQSVKVYEEVRMYGERSVKNSLADTVSKEELKRWMEEINAYTNTKAKGRRKSKLEAYNSLKIYAEMLMALYTTLTTGVEETTPADLMAEKLTEMLVAAKLPDVDVDDVHAYIENHEIRELVRSLRNVMKDNAVVTIKSRNGAKKTLYITVNEGKLDATSEMKDLIYKSERLVVIGHTVSEALLTACVPDETTIYRIEHFKYDNAFTVIEVGPKFSIQKVLKLLANRISTSARPLPVMILTKSKERQMYIWDELKALSPIAARCEDEADAERMHKYGAPVVFYQNSKISRGVDTDQFDVMIVESCDYALPYHTTYAPDAAMNMIKDETTNSVLRIAPTSDDRVRPKVIITSTKNAWKIKYLSNHITFDGTEEEMVEMLIQSNLLDKLMDIKLRTEQPIQKTELNIAVSKLDRELARRNERGWVPLSELSKDLGISVKILREAANELYKDGKVMLELAPSGYYFVRLRENEEKQEKKRRSG